MRTSGAVRAWRGDETLHQTPDTFIACVCVWMGHGLGVWCRRGGVWMNGQGCTAGRAAGPSEVCVGWVDARTCPVVPYETKGRPLLRTTQGT